MFSKCLIRLGSFFSLLQCFPCAYLIFIIWQSYLYCRLKFLHIKGSYIAKNISAYTQRTSQWLLSAPALVHLHFSVGKSSLVKGVLCLTGGEQQKFSNFFIIIHVLTLLHHRGTCIRETRGWMDMTTIIWLGHWVNQAKASAACILHSTLDLQCPAHSNMCCMYSLRIT